MSQLMDTYLDSWKELFTFNHSLAMVFLDEKKEEEMHAYFLPPMYAFLPEKLRSLKNFEIPWLYALWHELLHLEGLGSCYIEIYESILDNLSEDIAVYGFYQIANKNIVEGIKFVGKAVDLARKRKLFSDMSLITREVFPTYSQLDANNYGKIAESIHRLIPPFLDKEKLPMNKIEKLVKEWGQYLVSEIKRPQKERTMKNITREHELGYLYGETIQNKIRDTKFIKLVPTWCMNVDLSKIDLMKIRFEDLKVFIENNSENLVPDERLKGLVGGKTPLDEVEEPDESVGIKAYDEMFKMATHSDMPEKIRNGYKQAMETAMATGKSLFEEYHADGFVHLSEEYSLLDSAYGTIFAMTPSFLAGVSSKKFIQGGLSKSYAYELILRLFGYRRYPVDLLSTMRVSLNHLTPEIYDPKLYHFDVERWIKSNFPKEEALQILPPQKWF